MAPPALHAGGAELLLCIILQLYNMKHQTEKVTGAFCKGQWQPSWVSPGIRWIVDRKFIFFNARFCYYVPEILVKLHNQGDGSSATIVIGWGESFAEDCLFGNAHCPVITGGSV